MGSNGTILTADSGETLGVKWAAPASSGAMVQLFDSTLAATAATFDITSISGAYNHLKILAQLRTNQATTDDYAKCTFNNDSGNNYDGNAFYTVDTTLSLSGAESGIAFWRIANVVGANGTAGDFTVIDCAIPNYKGTTARKQAVSRWFSRAASNRAIMGNSGGNWRDTSAITRITITAGGGSSFIIGSRVMLYGIA